ncbi:hypothetical protein [Planktotalea sp.]|uniref:hypothetical protein n=1 Tax=Planktotalea sp. TaxID=2029877 RepID=UPI0026008793|nr:hypothetical protein [Planktotalea sp.]
MKFGDAEIHLDAEVDEVITSAMDRGITVFGRSAPVGSRAGLNVSAFLTQWQATERMFLENSNLSTSDDSVSKIIHNPRALFERAFKNKIIDSNLYRTLLELHHLKNLISHDLAAFETRRQNSQELMNLIQSVSERVTQALAKK